MFLSLKPSPFYSFLTLFLSHFNLLPSTHGTGMGNTGLCHRSIMLVLLTLPGLDSLHKCLIFVIKSLLKPFLSIVPFCLYLLLDIYWKYETRPLCESPTSTSCSPSEHLRYHKSIIKSQRNALLIAMALIFYWLLYTFTALVVRHEQLKRSLEKLKNSD